MKRKRYTEPQVVFALQHAAHVSLRLQVPGYHLSNS